MRSFSKSLEWGIKEKVIYERVNNRERICNLSSPSVYARRIPMTFADFIFFQIPTIFFLQLCIVFFTLFLIFSVIYTVKKYPFVLKGDFMPTKQPTTLLHITSGLLHEFGYFLTTSTECAIVIERVTACKHQRSYDQHGFNYKAMIPVIIIIVLFAITLTYFALIQGQTFACFIFCQCMDICTVVLAIFCNRYCRRRYRNLLVSTLSTKYQIREVSALTRALVPITFFSVIVKLLIAAELWCEFIFRERWPYMVIISAYQTLHTLIATLWCTLLLYRHRGRHRFVRLDDYSVVE